MQDLTAWARSMFNSILNSINLVVGGTFNQKLLEPIVTNFVGTFSSKHQEDIKDEEPKREDNSTKSHSDKDSTNTKKTTASPTLSTLFPQSVIDKNLVNSKSSQGFPVACATDSNLNLVQIRNNNGMVSGFDISTDLDNGGFWDNPPSFEVPSGLNPYGIFEVKGSMGGGNDLSAEASNFLSQSLPIQQQQQQQLQQAHTNSKYVMRRSKANSLSRPYPYLSQPSQQHLQHHQQQHQHPQTPPIQHHDFAPHQTANHQHVPQSFLDIETTTYSPHKSFDTFSPPELERHPSPPGYYFNSPDETALIGGFPDSSFSQNQQHSNVFNYDSVSSVSSVSPMEQPIAESFVVNHGHNHSSHYAPGGPPGHPVMVHGLYPLVHSRANSELSGSPGDNGHQTLYEVEKPAVDDMWSGLPAGFPASGEAALVLNGANSQQFLDMDNTAATNFHFSSAPLVMEGVSPQSSIVSMGSSHHSNSFSHSDSDDSPQGMFSGPFSLDEQQQDDGKANMQFICPYCDAGFKIKGYLTRHVKKHALEKAYTCPFFESSDETPCHPSGGFSRRDTYKTHLKARHFEYPPGTRSEHRSKVGGSCKGCGQNFTSNEEWVEQHIQGQKCSGLRLHEHKVKKD